MDQKAGDFFRPAACQKLAASRPRAFAALRRCGPGLAARSDAHRCGVRRSKPSPGRFRWPSANRSSPHLSAMAQRLIGQHAGHHGFAHRHGADTDAGIVTALGDDLRLRAGSIDGLARAEDG